MMCSEDVKCFYYLFRVPPNWYPYMGFAKEIPAGLVPEHLRGKPCHLVSRVLPMGWNNSVGLAQRIHRNVVQWSMGFTNHGAEQELRRDRTAPSSSRMRRVYLDNWDEIRRVDKDLVAEVEGVPSLHQMALRQQYECLEVPRHPKKAVESSLQAEIQGAILDGDAGVAYAKPSKILKYMGLAWELVQRGRSTLKELQVVTGGLVYISMFRRPLLSALNHVWEHMELIKHDPPVVKRLLPREVQRELVRFLCLVPLAQMDFRLPMVKQVTASDASTTGGGISATLGVTSYGLQAVGALIRGEKPEPGDRVQILTIGLFDGIASLRVAADILELPLVGHVSVECNPAAKRVVESLFPGCKHLGKVQDVTAEEVAAWACEYTGVSLILLGAGPPCQDVSRLNVDRAGSQKGFAVRYTRKCLA